MSRHHNSDVVNAELKDTIFLETSKGKRRRGRINLMIKSILSGWPNTILRVKIKRFSLSKSWRSIVSWKNRHIRPIWEEKTTSI